jgi:hypothetical protein
MIERTRVACRRWVTTQYAAYDSLLRSKLRCPPNVTPAGQRKSIFPDDGAQATRRLNLRYMREAGKGPLFAKSSPLALFI